MDNLLRIENISLELQSKTEKLKLTENVSLEIKPGETVGIIGESGCGKSLTALSILGLLDSNIKITEGKIFFKDICLNELPPEKLRKICGKEIGMVFQEPMTALNPVFTIEQQLMAPMKEHLKLTKKELKNRCITLLQDVGIKNPERVLKSYPHELSGGMRQRIVIAIAIACQPKLLIADEPTTALDVTIQQQILIVLKRLIHKNKMALLIISHDMGVISMMAEWISVMYGGEVVEKGAKDDIMKRSLHPYSAKLIEAANNLNNGDGELVIVEGNVPRPGDDIQGCKFSNRCEYCMEKCLKMKPPCVESGKGYVRCWKYVEEQSENVGR